MAEELKVTESLARYVATTRYENLSPEVCWEAKRRTADVLAIGLSGSASGRGMRAFAREVSLGGGASVWGSGETVSAEIAALANATMAFHLELDDVHRTSHTPPPSP